MSNSRRVVQYIEARDGDVIDFGDSGFPGISGTHNWLGMVGRSLVFLVNPERSGKPRKVRKVVLPAAEAMAEALLTARLGVEGEGGEEQRSETLEAATRLLRVLEGMGYSVIPSPDVS